MSVSGREQFVEYLAIAAGGVIGSLARAAIDAALPTTPFGFPWSTFLINISGSLLLGWLSAELQIRAAPGPLRLFVTVGVLGAYTTFSTFALQFWLRMTAAAAATAVLYAAASLSLGIAAATFGYRLAARRRETSS